jgi:predicted small lipoprotein YifL
MMICKSTATVLLTVLALTIGACAQKGPVEKVGEKVDHAVDTIKNGGQETTGDKIQDSVDKAQDKAADATDKVEGK